MRYFGRRRLSDLSVAEHHRHLPVVDRRPAFGAMADGGEGLQLAAVGGLGQGCEIVLDLGDFRLASGSAGTESLRNMPTLGFLRAAGGCALRP